MQYQVNSVKELLYFIFFILVTFQINGQTVVAPDCSDAINNNICTDAAFQIDPNGAGLEELDGSTSNPSTNPSSGNSGCLLTGETNSTWMIINISGSGLLEFSFGQDGGTGCLDWIMWEYSATACDEIFGNTLAPISCNWNGQCEGFTGIASTLPPGGAASNFEPGINAAAGEQYLICLSNYSSQSTNLPLNFFGTADVSCEAVLPITVNDTTICPGTDAVLTASAATATGPLDYLWDSNNETTASITVSPGVTTSYSVTVTETLPSGVLAVGIGEGIVTVLAANDPQCICTVDASNNGPICFNSTFDLNATAVSNGTYEWDIIGEVIGSGQNLIGLPALAPGTWPIQVTATDDNGFVCTDVTQLVIMPSTDPQCSCEISASNTGPICFNATFDLSATAVSNGTYEWSVDGVVIGTEQNLTNIPALAPGIWTVQVTAIDDSGFECIGTTQLEVIAGTDPQCSCEISASNTGPICYNATFDLSSSAVSNGTYEWSVDGVVIGTEQNLTNIPALAPGVWTVQVIAIDDNGFECMATTELEVLSEIDPQCSCTVTASNTSPICLNDVFNLSAVSSSNCTYTWDLLGSVVGTEQNMTGVPGTTSGTYSYQVIATDDNGFTCTAITDVVVHQLPEIGAGADGQACFGDDINLSATGGQTYNWFDGTQTYSNITNTITFNITADQTFFVEGIDLNGCSNFDTLLYAVISAQSPLLSEEINLICLGESVTLSNLNTNAVSSSWYFSNGNESVGSNNPSPFIFNDSGCSDLTLMMTDNNGCDTSVSYSNVVCVESVTASFYVNPGTIGPGNGEVNFYNTSVGGDYFEWIYGDGSVSTQFEGSHTYDVALEDGFQATLIAYTPNNCSDTVSIPITYQEELIYYIPNTFTPDADEHNQTFKPVFTSGFDPYNYEITIYNRWGELVWKSFDHTQGWDGAYSATKGIPVQEGQYNWIIKFKPKDTDGKTVIHGSVNLLK